MEPTEIEEFTKEMTEGGETGMKTVSLMISILAVLVAMVTVLGHRTHTEAILSQSKAADAWAEYQSHNLREGEIDTRTTLLTLQPNSNDAAVRTQLAKDNAAVAKHEDAKTKEKEEATDLQREGKLDEARADRYDLGEALLQIAVVLSSITLLTRQRAYFFMGLTLGIAGMLTAASALLVH